MVISLIVARDTLTLKYTGYFTINFKRSGNEHQRTIISRCVFFHIRNRGHSAFDRFTPVLFQNTARISRRQTLSKIISAGKREINMPFIGTYEKQIVKIEGVCVFTYLLRVFLIQRLILQRPSSTHVLSDYCSGPTFAADFSSVKASADIRVF